jgi:hypothetical protein
MAAPGVDGVAQPILRIPSLIQAGLDSGKLFRNGSVVRVVATGRFHTFLDEIPGPEKLAQEAAKRAAKVDLKIVMPVVLATAAVVGAVAAFVIKKRKNADGLDVLTEVKADEPECVSNFEASLRAYVDAGRDGILDAEIVDRLIADLDEVKEWADGGNTVEFSFEQLEPLFRLVIGHTPALARAYSVAVADFEHPESDSDAGVVVQLRQHLEVQKRILGRAA